MPSAGRSNCVSVAAITTRDARGTPATPLLVSIRGQQHRDLRAPCQGDIINLRNIDAREGAIHHRPDKIEGIAEREHER